jgi:polyferredoxin
MNRADRTLDLFRKLPLLERVLKTRVFQPVMLLLTLAVFTLVILTGLFGTPVGSRNFGIIFVWIVWWGLLIILLVPFLGRFWCAVCPIPAPGEWLQRRSIITKRLPKLRTLNQRWPRRLKNMWLQNFGFLGVALFSAIILTRPTVSALVLLGFIVLGVVLSVFYRNRVFCRYVCPVGGFIGLYSMVSPLELRVRDPQVCRDHTTKDCLTGNVNGYGCPWMVFPGELQRNTYCGLCMECLKTCPKNNIALNLRPPGTDLWAAEERRIDEAYKSFIMLTCALVYSVVLLGPWGWLKGWANMESLLHWLAYAGGFLAANLLIVPGLFALTSAASWLLARRAVPLRRLFIDYAYTLVPMGLAAWVAFSLGFVLINGSYAIQVLSDPFGWGWNLFGSADALWTPAAPQIIGFLQTGVLIAGLMFSVRTAHKIARQHARDPRLAFRMLLPVSGTLTAVTLAFLWLYLG